MFRMCRITGKGSLSCVKLCSQIQRICVYLNFSIYHHEDLDTSFSLSFQDMVQPPILFGTWWSSQEQFGTKPPIFNIDCLFCILQRNRYRLSRQYVRDNGLGVDIPSNSPSHLHTTLHYFLVALAQMIRIDVLPQFVFVSRRLPFRVLRHVDDLG